MNDLISIIIPLYNRQKFISECIDSIIAQSYQNFEIILIDDGSSDQTVEVCRNLAKEEPRIKLFTMEHAGASAARNKGLDNAIGEYIFFIDSDDVIHPLLLETLIRGMKESDATISGSGIVNIGEKRWDIVYKRIEQDNGPGETTYQNNSDTLHAFFHTTSPINLIGGVMMRRELIGETRFNTDLFIGEDFYFVYENLLKGPSSVFLKQKWYYCRLHKHNSSNNLTYSGFWNRFYRRELVWKNEEALGRTEYANIQKRFAYDIFLNCIYRNRNNRAEVKKMCKVIKDYKKIIFPAISFRSKLFFHLFVYIPSTYSIMFKIKNTLRKIKTLFKKLFN